MSITESTTSNASAKTEMTVTALKSSSFVLYQKIAHEFSSMEEESLSPVRARRILISALSLVPNVIVRESYGSNTVQISHKYSPSESFEVHLQDSIDGLLLLWNDYIKDID